MTKKRFIKLLMGRFRFSRNEAREIAACVQWNKRRVDDTNSSAKYNLSGYREFPESYQSNWRRIRWTCFENEKYGGFDYCPSCHTVRPFVWIVREKNANSVDSLNLQGGSCFSTPCSNARSTNTTC